MSGTKLEAFCKGLQTKCVDLVLALLNVRLQWFSLPEYVKRKKNPKKQAERQEWTEISHFSANT